MSAMLFKLPIHATPGARRTEAAGAHGAALRVRLAAPPIDDKAFWCHLVVNWQY